MVVNVVLKWIGDPVHLLLPSLGQFIQLKGLHLVTDPVMVPVAAETRQRAVSKFAGRVGNV